MADATRDHLKVNPWIIAIAVMSSTFMEVLDTTIVNVSLPHIAGSLSATVEEATWVLTSYLVSNAIILPLTGWLGNHFGRRRLLMVSVSGFTAASFLCGAAPSLGSLILFRVIQGAAGGCLQPISQAVLLETFPPEGRGKAMAFWGLGIVVAPILGPVLGGWVTDNYTWRWVFYINLPIGIISILMIRQFIFDPSYIRRATSKIDYWGIGMLAVGIGALQVVLDKGEIEDWFASDWILGMTILSVATIAVFIVHELYSSAPVVNLRVFRIGTYRTGVILMTMLGFALYGSIVMLPIMLQTVMGYTALDAGFATAPRGVGAFLAMPLVGILIVRVDPRKMLACGVVIASATLFVLADLNIYAGYWDIFWPQIIQGTAMGMLWVPLTTITMDPIPNEQMGNATSIFNLTRNLGASIGISTATTLLSRRQQFHFNVLGAHVSGFNLSTQLMLERTRAAFQAVGSDFYTASQQSFRALAAAVGRQAAMISFLDIYWLLGVIFLLMLPLVMLMRRPTHRSRPGTAAH